MSPKTEPGIVFDHIWKKFRRGEVHDSLRDLIPAVTRRLLGRPSATDESLLTPKEFWALSDVSFEVKPGQALGIIGPNGAGKSTVLKTLNRIIRPTRGWCEIRGRAGSLIEVSAGFHQDLTGRQNVFLQGAIMGMRKVEIDRKFDEIVAFSGIEEFIDTPVKRYSSGMNARLGFSIACHLDPDVLIIDEVLAVGDMSFQERAFGRIRQMVQSGIPVIIVSHQLDRIATLCTKAILLQKGHLTKEGTPAECIAAYVTEAGQDVVERRGDAPVHLDSIELLTTGPIHAGDRVVFRVTGVADPGSAGTWDPFGIRVRSAQTGRVMYGAWGRHHGVACPEPGEFEAEVELQLNTAPGIYAIETSLREVNGVKEELKGPFMYLQVVEGESRFEGPVQMNADMRVVAPRRVAVATSA